MKMNKLTVVLIAAAAAILMADPFPAHAENIDSRIGKLEFTHDFVNGYPREQTVEKLFDEMDFQRAVQAYIWSLPLVSWAN